MNDRCTGLPDNRADGMGDRAAFVGARNRQFSHTVFGL